MSAHYIYFINEVTNHRACTDISYDLSASIEKMGNNDNFAFLDNKAVQHRYCLQYENVYPVRYTGNSESFS